MEKLKVMTIVGTRPEIIRLSEVIKACDRYFDHHLVHTGQNYDYELNVLNGIAYDSNNDRLFITGKLWPELFEIKLIEKF